MSKTLRIVILLLFSIIFINPAFCGQEFRGTAGPQFLKMEAGARPAALGSAFVGAADDVSAAYWNPSGLIEINDRQVTFMYNMWFQGINAGYLAYAQPVERTKTVKLVDQKGQIKTEERKEKMLAFGTSLTYVGYGNMPRTFEDAGGNYAGTEGFFSASDYSLSLSGATRLPGTGDIGISVKFISSSISTYSAFGVALDIGIMYPVGDKFRIGLILQNFGTNMKYIQGGANVTLPSNFKAGVSYKILDTKSNFLLALVDVNVPSDNIPSVCAGVEYTFNDMVSIRAGYKGTEPAGISFGGGVKMQTYFIDYAYVPFGELGATHRISVTAHF